MPAIENRHQAIDGIAHLHRIEFRGLTCACAMAAALLASPVSAQQAGSPSAPPTIQAALANDVGTLSDKFVGLARRLL